MIDAVLASPQNTFQITKSFHMGKLQVHLEMDKRDISLMAKVIAIDHTLRTLLLSTITKVLDAPKSVGE